MGHPTGWTDGSVEQGGFLGAGGGGREGAGGISPSFRARSRFRSLCRKGVPAAAAPPPPRCPTALPRECVTAIFQQDPVPSAVKLLPGALAFIFHRFLENAFSPLSLAVRSWPSPWIFEGRFLTPPFFRVPFQSVFISPTSHLKSKQEKNPSNLKYKYKPGQEAPPLCLLEREGVGATPRKSEKLDLMGGHC